MLPDTDKYPLTFAPVPVNVTTFAFPATENSMLPLATGILTLLLPLLILDTLIVANDNTLEPFVVIN